MLYFCDVIQFNVYRHYLNHFNQFLFVCKNNHRITFYSFFFSRVLKNRTIHVPPEVPVLNHPLRISKVPKKESIHSSKKAIGKFVQVIFYSNLTLHQFNIVHVLFSTTSFQFAPMLSSFLSHNFNMYRQNEL